MSADPTQQIVKGFSGPNVPKEEDLYKCVHCGLCLNHCPTYLELCLETESPRGRLTLMKGVMEGRIGITGNVIEHWELCLQCRACEAVCPSGVPFGQLMEDARAQIQRGRQAQPLERALRFLVFREILPHQRRLELIFAALRIYQRSGLQKVLRRLPMWRLLPENLARMEEMMPEIPRRFFSPSKLGSVSPIGERRHRVAFFSGCVMPLMYGSVNEATVRVLARNGCEVVVPREQGCCGALNVHSGEREQAKAMAKQNIDAFLGAGVEAVIVNSAGCGAMLKEYGELLEEDPEYREKAKRLSAMVKDMAEFLVDLPFDQRLGAIFKKITYQDSCHLAHAQRIKEQPRKLLSAIPGLELVEMQDSDNCCGAAGIYSITHTELSMKLLDTKMANIAPTEAELVVSANPGCMLQLSLGMKRAGLPGRSVHLVELLDQAYQLAETS
ncbi:MAG: heterodisulfide reductase-related iron-sulfur binding cluster [Dehalococcoidia bacterium]